MLLKSRKFAVMAACSLSILTGAAQAHVQAQELHASNAVYGQPETAGVAGREITITPTTKWVNVKNGENVRFAVAGKVFTWHFDTFRESDSFALSAITPHGLVAPQIQVYVSPNPAYSN
jgi:hypothetical protein